MNSIELIKTLAQMDDKTFIEMKELLIEKILNFVVLDSSFVTKGEVLEKLADYIEKTTLKEKKSFETLVDYFMNSFNGLIKPYLSKVLVGKDSKGKEIYQDSRAMKYFNQVQRKRKETNDFLCYLEDFARISFCLYNEIIKQKHQAITDFDYSFESVDCCVLIDALQLEKSCCGQAFL